MFKSHKRPVILTLAMTVVLLGGGSAFAYWSSTGAGTGTATVATPDPLVISQTAVSGLYPGAAQELKGTVTNPNAFDVNVMNDFTVTVAVDSDHAACGAANFEVVAPTAAAATIPAGAGVTFGGGSITMVNSPTVDQAPCYGAVLTLAFELR